MKKLDEKKLHEIKIEVTLLSPWLVQGNDPGRYGLDAVQLRGPNNERLIPGSLLLGRIRESCQEVGGTHLTTCNNWFGQEAQAYEPHRSKVWLTDLLEEQPQVLAVHKKLGLPLIRVSLDKQTQAGEEGMLQFIEQSEPVGSEINFSGTWRVRCTVAQANDIKKTIHLGLALHSQLGAYRNIGFGKVQAVAVTVQNAPCLSAQFTPPTGTNPTSAIGLSLAFNTPLAVGNRLINGNIFVSDTVISGATLKGALATLWADDLPKWFDALHIATALPSKSNTARTMPIPLSWAITPSNDGNDGLIDTSHSGHGLDEKGMALAFQSDWKPRHFAQASQMLGLGATRRYQRVRTAIEAGRAKEGQLFAYQMVLAEEKETHWLSHCRLSGEHADAANYKDLCDRLSALQESGWGPIGKTDAFAKLTLIDNTQSTMEHHHTPGTDLALMLVSDGGLLTSQDLLSTNSNPPDLNSLYQSMWHDIATQLKFDAPTLMRLFVQHRPMGGEYMAHRFFTKHSDDKTYLPRFLTQAGSVFVLRFADANAAEQALACLQQRASLPLPEAVKAQHGDSWQRNPYLPENGFGEIALVPRLATASEQAHLGETA